MESPRTLGRRVAEELRAELARQEKSRRWLATQTGLSQATVARYVKGTYPPSMDDLDAMCRALDITIADILERVDRNGGYDPKPVGEGQCAIRDLNPEPADSLSWVVDALWPCPLAA